MCRYHTVRGLVAVVSLPILMACGSSVGEGAEELGTDVTWGETATPPDQFSQPEFPTYPDWYGNQDVTPDVLVSDLPPTDLVDLQPGNDAADTALPELLPPKDVTVVPEAMYTKCMTESDCPDGYVCLKVRDNPLWGQCTIPCQGNDTCPPAPHGNPTACWGDHNVCISLCDIHGGTCPEWLECIGMEVCLEHADIAAVKGPGERCNETAECAGNAECISGEVTEASCFPLCNSDADCAAAAPDAYGMCTSAGSFAFCMFYCGFMGQGKDCPGDMWCEAVVCR